MTFKVIWSAFAETQFEEIYHYYHTNISEKLAKAISKKMLLSVKQLEITPLIGQIEELLKNRSTTFRYLVYSNYKIVYSVEGDRKFVKIHDVFDTRQNPIKIKRTL